MNNLKQLVGTSTKLMFTEQMVLSCMEIITIEELEDFTKKYKRLTLG